MKKFVKVDDSFLNVLEIEGIGQLKCSYNKHLFVVQVNGIFWTYSSEDKNEAKNIRDNLLKKLGLLREDTKENRGEV